MTHRQIGKILEAVKKGKTLEQAVKSAGITIEKYKAAVEEDSELEEIILQALATARAAGTATPAPSSPPKAPSPPALAPPVQVAPVAAAPAPAPPEPAPHAPPTIVIAEPEPDPDPPPEPEPWRLDKEQISQEAAELAPGMFGYLLWVDQRVVDYGMPRMSDWWRFAISGFYASGKRWGIFRVGRGGGKSTTLTRIAATEGLFAERQIPPGQRWIWPFISINTEDAGRRIVEIASVLRAVGLTPEIKRPNGRPTIELVDVNAQTIAFISLASSISGVSGPSTIGATLDEEAKLRDRAKNANPATEILASLVQTFRARDGIRGIRCSSAWNNLGSHAQAIAEGDTSANFVARLGEQFLQSAIDGLLDVADFESATGGKDIGDKIRAYARTLTAESPNVPTWIANPTIGALASRMEVNAIAKDSNLLRGITRGEYWLRENVSLPLKSASAMGVGDMDALAAMNARLTAGTRNKDSLQSFDGLYEADPRSHSHAGTGRGPTL